MHKTVLTARENEDQWCCKWSQRCSSQEMKPVFHLFSSTSLFPTLPSGTTADETTAPAAASTSEFSKSDLWEFYFPPHACILNRWFWTNLGKECTLLSMTIDRSSKVDATTAGRLTSLHSGVHFPFTHRCESSVYGVFAVLTVSDKRSRLLDGISDAECPLSDAELLTNALRFGTVLRHLPPKCFSQMAG